MIRPLRRLHRWAIAGLAVVLPVVFALGLAARRPNPVSTLPAALAPPASALVGGRSLGRLWPGLEIEARVGRDPADPARPVLLLIPASPPEAPDLLVYWAPEGATASPTLAPGAVLVGSLAGTAPQAFQLPAEAAAESGSAVLYSLAWGRVVAAATLPAAAAP